MFTNGNTVQIAKERAAQFWNVPTEASKKKRKKKKKEEALYGMETKSKQTSLSFPSKCTMERNYFDQPKKLHLVKFVEMLWNGKMQNGKNNTNTSGQIFWKEKETLEK